MTAPTHPYSTGSQVAYLLQAMFLRGGPTATTVPNEDTVATLISWSDAVVDATFQSVGYYIPFQAMSGETWPEHQTSLISYMSAIGAAALASGYVLMPYPTRGIPRGGGEQSAYAALFEKFRSQVLADGFRFRALFYLGTKAEKWLSDPYGPRGDFQEDYVDPTRYQFLREYTDMRLDRFDEELAIGVDWDYLYDLRAAAAA